MHDVAIWKSSQLVSLYFTLDSRQSGTQRFVFFEKEERVSHASL
jgi:hypothetical protein